MNEKVNEKFPIIIHENGTVIDFIDQEFVAVMKDDTWSEYELNALKRNKMQVNFVFLKGVACILIQIQDAIEVSDFILHIKETSNADIDLDTLLDKELYLQLYLIDKDNMISGVKKVTLTKDFEKEVIEAMKKQASFYDPEVYEGRVYAIQQAYEPFELEQFSTATNAF